MQYPTFSADTYFIDNGSKQIRYADRSRLRDGTELRPCGVRDVSKIETESGMRLLLASETIFALTQNAGKLMRYLPYIPSLPLPLDGEELPYVFAGAVCATGRHSNERNRPSNMRVHPNLVEAYLSALNLKHGEMLKSGVLSPNYQSFPKVVASSSEFDYPMVKGRALSDMIGDRLTEKTQLPAEMTLFQRRSFLTGLLSSLFVLTNGSIVFAHCHADVVEAVYLWLWRDFGVPSSLHINPMESRVTHYTRGVMPHHIRLSSEDVEIASIVGLYLPKVRCGSPNMVRHDVVTKISSYGAVDCVEVIASVESRSYTANSIMFKGDLIVPPEAITIASNPTLHD